jgi:hypothetical protein
MSFRLETPKTLGTKEMFMWWCKEKIKKKRHLKLLYTNSHSKPTQLVSRNGDELKWLRQNVIVMAEQIEKLQIIDMKSKHSFTKETRRIYELNREIYDSRQRIKHLEQVDNNRTEIVESEKDFRRILETYNLKVRDELINNAETINMKQNMGFLYIKRVDRARIIDSNAKSLRMPNWGESKKKKDELIAAGIQPKNEAHPEGKNWIVYFDDESWMRFNWTKYNGACKVKNYTSYKFMPSGGINGPRKQLTKANRSNPFLAMTYKVDNGYSSHNDTPKE